MQMNKKGIYKIRNKVNGMLYIGKTESSFEQRWKQHLFDLMECTHSNSRLQKDFQKYGISAFTFSIVEVLEDKAIMAVREQIHIARFGLHHKLYNVKDRELLNHMKGKRTK